MGNIQNLDKNHFFHKIKQSSSYKDFVIKMNQLLSRPSTIWSFDEKSLNSDDIQQYKEKVENFFIYVTEFIFERSVKKQNPTKEELQQVSTFLNILCQLSVQTVFFDKDFFNQLFFYRVSKDYSVEIAKNEQDEIQDLKIDDEEFTGKDEQIPIFIKLIYSCLQLFNKNNFAIYYKNDIYNQDHKLWTSSLQRDHISKNRNNLTQFLIRIILIEQKLDAINKYKGSSSVCLMKGFENIQKIIPQIVYSALYYEENGIFPYSAYFYKEQLEGDLQTSLLCLQICILLLKNNKMEEGDETNEKIIMVKKFLKNKQKEDQSEKQSVFKNQVFVDKVLKKIIRNLNTFHEKDDTILPNSFLESPLNQEIILLLLLFIIESEECQKSLFQQKSHYNILMNLIIILDQVSLNFNDAMYYCTCSALLQLSSTAIKLNEENSYNYQFKKSPVISGKTVDYIICSLISLMRLKLDQETFCSSIQIFASILQNISNHYVVLSESSSLQILNFISELENYKEMLKNLNLMILSYGMLNFIQNVLANNFLKNIDLQSFVFLYRASLERLMKFGNNKDRLGLILYEEKITQTEGKINLELEEDEALFLDNLYDQIQKIKSQFNFETLQTQMKHIEEHLIEFKEKKNSSYFEKSHKIRNLLKKQKVQFKSQNQQKDNTIKLQSNHENFIGKINIFAYVFQKVKLLRNIRR